MPKLCGQNDCLCGKIPIMQKYIYIIIIITTTTIIISTSLG